MASNNWDCVREVTGSSDTIYHIPDGLLHSFAINGVVYQVHVDPLGSVRLITDDSGTVVARLEYGAYGEEIFVSAISALTNFPYRFVGGAGVRTDATTGLIWMRERWFDPSLQRFVSRDPIGLKGGTNLFAYAGANRVVFIDPMGLKFNIYDCIGDCMEKYDPLNMMGKAIVNFPNLPIPDKLPIPAKFVPQRVADFVGKVNSLEAPGQ